MNNIVAFLPLKTSPDGHRKDYAGNLWRTRFLLDSLERHLTEPLDLCVCCPASEVDVLSSELLSTGKVKITFVNEETIVPGIGASSGHGWYKQQVLTIAFAAEQSKSTLRLDPDIWLVRPLSEADLWRDGKTANDIWTRSHQPSDFVNSAKILGRTFNHPPDWPCIGDTPFTFHCDAVRFVADYIRKRCGFLGLARKTGWTEISVYSLLLDAMGGDLKYHFKQPLHGTRILHQTEVGKKRINADDGFFAILNSRLNLSEALSMRIMEAA